MNVNKPTLEQVAVVGNYIFGNEDKFKRWMDSPITALGHIKPRTLMHTRKGRKRILIILARIEHGVYS